MTNHQIKAGIIGATGYAGAVLIGILLRHPKVKIEWATWLTENKNESLSEVYPHLQGLIEIRWQEPDYQKLVKKVEVVFLAVPHKQAMKFVPQLCEAGVKVIDLSADYRLSDSAVYEKWYQEHTSPFLLKEAVYGLPELYREKIKKAQLIANPGCYPTVSILGIAPLVKNGLVELDSIIIDAKSGVSGAGRSPNLVTHYPECNEGIKAYAINSHRHKPEIEQELSKLAGKNFKVSFVPHLTPMNRGILATIYASLKKEADFKKLYQDFYRDEPFVRFSEKIPSTKNVWGSNFCEIAVSVDKETRRVTITSVIDNLVKGAAGQAVQNLNLLFDFDEKAGIDLIATYP